MTWNTANPPDNEAINNGASRIREFKTDLATMVSTEFVFVTATPKLFLKPQMGATGSRPAGPQTGQIYINTTLNVIERYSGSAWVPFAILYIQAWDSAVTYPAGAVVWGNTSKLYISIQASNTNNTPSATADTAWWVLINKTITKPTKQILTSGSSATYTTPANCTRIAVKMVGGGGGASSQAANGVDGSDTSFNSIVAKGGKKGLQSDGSSGAGGTGGSGSVDLRIAGNPGTSGIKNADGVTFYSGNGGGSFFGGGGPGQSGTGTGGGQPGATNSGGGGAGNIVGGAGGSGGGSGEYAEFRIASPAATYTYTIGAGGGGGAGVGSGDGGNGAAGIIIVDEYYD